jgi:hypothetical protein
VLFKADAQVRDSNGEPIPGTYTTGATMGIDHRVHARLTSVLRRRTFGWNAASELAVSTLMRPGLSQIGNGM